MPFKGNQSESGSVNAEAFHANSMDAGAGIHRLGGGPCANTGTNQTRMIDAKDLAYRKRIIRSIVDLGAYEPPLKGALFLFN